VRRRLRLRGRLTLMSAAIVGLVLVAGSVAAYVAVGNALRGQLDDQLRAQSGVVQRFPIRQAGGGLGPGPAKPPEESDFPRPRARQGGPVQLGQFLTADGDVLRRFPPGDQTHLPVTDADRRLARDGGRPFFTDQTVDGLHVRVLTLPLPAGQGAAQIAQPLTSVDNALGDLRLVLLLLVVVGTGAAALLARAFSRRVLEPVTALTEAAEHIEATGDLGRRVDAGTDDEVGRMATSFNGMLDRVEDSVVAQRQLVADASHELRTPVSALRTNVEVLAEAGAALDAEQRRAILTDVVAQADELGVVVGDLMELARGEESGAGMEDVRLDTLVREAVERARRHAPAVAFTTTLAPVVLVGASDRLARALNNLLDNAAKYGPPDGPVDVSLELQPDGVAVVAVRDHGPGVDPAEVDHIFDRFARGALSRMQAGAGLGLAIVRQVAHAHGGTASVQAAPGGGARFVLAVPHAAAPDA